MASARPPTADLAGPSVNCEPPNSGPTKANGGQAARRRLGPPRRPPRDRPLNAKTRVLRKPSAPSGFGARRGLAAFLRGKNLISLSGELNKKPLTFARPRVPSRLNSWA